MNNDAIVHELTLEGAVTSRFGLAVDIDSIIVHRIPVGRTSQATVFLTKKKQLYAYIASQSPLTLSDVRKIVHKMGLHADAYVPPKGRPQYFDEIGTKKFQETFPGRRVSSQQDIAFYRTLAPYNPALILVGEVTGGELFQFDPDSASQWRVASKFTYRRIKTS